jgi:hypothetical protein
VRSLLPPFFLALLALAGTSSLAQEVPARGAPSAETTANPANCTVSGTVLRKGTDEPIHFARITLDPTNKDQKKFHSITGPNGKFTITDVPPGEYLLSVVRNGYVRESYGAMHPLDPPTPLNITTAKPLDYLLFRLTPAGVITGHVRDENGEPLPGAEVNALLRRFVAGKQTLIPAGEVLVNDLGEYRLFELTPGKYLLSVSLRPNFGFLMSEGFMNSQRNSEEREGSVTTYYPGTTDPAQATSVNVDPGSEVRSLDFSLSPSGIFHIRGHVFGIDAKDSRRGGTVMLLRASDRLMALFPEKSAAIDAKDGNFDISEVAPGSYEVLANGVADGIPVMGHRSVEVSGSDAEGVDITFKPNATVQGHLHWEDKSTAANGTWQVSLDGYEQLYEESSAEVQPDGSFELKYVGQDAYSLNITGPAPDAYLKTASYGSSDALGTFHVTPGSDAILDLLISSRGAHIHGTVMNSDPVPVSGVWVALIPDDANAKIKRLYQSMRTTANGKFEFRGVAPGTYSLYSWDYVEEHDWDDPEFLKPFKTKSASVTVAEGDTKSLDLTLIQTQSESEAKQ